jgi:hypothetical protein
LFFEGILKNEGGGYFDGVSFHAYDYYSGSVGRYVSPKWNSSQSSGPVVIAKANYLSGLMNNYGVTGKFLINTETALICGLATDPPGESPCLTNPGSSFERTKAYYVAQVYAAGQALNLKASIWYSVLGWRNSGLLNRDLSTRPAYTAYSIARRELSDATFVRAITEFPDVLGYEFHRGDRRVWVIWSGNVGDHAINLPGEPLVIYDALGEAVPFSNPLNVSEVPLYIEWAP